LLYVAELLLPTEKAELDPMNAEDPDAKTLGLPLFST
jgi:hypothetical protein